MDETVEQPADLEEELRRRARLFRRLRIAVLALVVGYFFLPYDIRTWIPVWLPFLAALGLEIDFFVGGWLKARSGEAEPSPLGKHGPQPRDLADFGGPSWQEAFTVEHDGEQILVPAIGATAEDDERARRRGRAFPCCGGGAPVALEAPSLGRPRDRGGRRRRDRRRDPRLRLAPARLERGLAGESGPRRGALLPRGGQDRRPPRNRHVRPQRPLRRLHTGRGRPGLRRRQARLPGAGSRDRLYQLAFKHRVQSFPETGRAIAVLAHESWHLRGVANEGLANCYAFQSGVRVGVDLGLSEGTARAMMREQLATNASDAGGNVAYVVPPGCHDGGAQDLHPGSNAFP